jgi:hypothetical protein
MELPRGAEKEFRWNKVLRILGRATEILVKANLLKRRIMEQIENNSWN